MSRPDTWMPLYIGDYLADTRRLSTLEHGAYLLIIMDYWRNGPPPDDDKKLALIAGLSPIQWKKMSETIRSFFTKNHQCLHHKRIDAEIAHASEVSDKRRAAARSKHSETTNGGGSNSPPNAEQMDDNCDANGGTKRVQNVGIARARLQSQPQSEEEPSPYPSRKREGRERGRARKLGPQAALSDIKRKWNLPSLADLDRMADEDNARAIAEAAAAKERLQ